MNPSTQEIVRAAAEAAQHLVAECRKDGPLYGLNARAVAQVSRTGKWLLNALAALRQALDTPGDRPQP